VGSDAALARLVTYDWPGNVRELRNVVERALILASHTGLAGPSTCHPCVTPASTPRPQSPADR
jgi:DNA-binding NtrC family response regulator